MLSHITSGVNHVDALELRGATIGAEVVLNRKKVLLSLVAVASECNVHSDLVDTVRSVHITVNMDAINDPIGQVQKSSFNGIGHSERGRSADFNGDCGESLVEARLEGQGESSTSSSCSSAEEIDSLSLVLNLIQLVKAAIHHIIAVRAHALGAIRIAVLRVTNATTDLQVIKAVIGK